MFACEYCKNEYATKSSLNHHKRTAKKCLLLREPIDKINLYKCKKCNYETSRKSSLIIHVCKIENINEFYEKKLVEYKYENNNLKLKLEKYEEEISRLVSDNFNLQTELKEYKDKIFELASKPTSINNNTNTKTTTNNNTNNLIISDWRKDTITEKVERGFTMEHLEDGLKGVARFTDEHIIKGPDGKKSLVCSDPSRMIFKYKDENGVVQKDVRATKLKNAIKDPIIKKSQEMFTTESSRLFDVISRAPDEDININGMSLIDFTNAKIDNLRDNFLLVKRIDDNADIYAKELVLLTN